MKAITINGWGQVHDSIGYILPDGLDKVTNIDYAAYQDWNSLIKSLPKKQNVDLLIGWSLGGQIAIRLIEKKIIKTKLLVLLSTPFQFVADEKVPFGMNPFMFHAFKASFQMIPSDTMKRFAVMIAQHDSNMKEIISELGIDRVDEYKWLEWLDEIGKFSCFDIDFSKFPRSLIVHGDGDTIVDIRQSQLFAEKIPNSHFEIFEKCGHAPHLHNSELLKALISEELKNLNVR